MALVDLHAIEKGVVDQLAAEALHLARLMFWEWRVQTFAEPHDVSDEKRDADGKWTSGAALGPEAAHHHATITTAIRQHGGKASVMQLRDALKKNGVHNGIDQANLIHAHHLLGHSTGGRTGTGKLSHLSLPNEPAKATSPPPIDHNQTITDAIKAEGTGHAAIHDIRAALAKSGVTDKKEQDKLINAHHRAGHSHAHRTAKGLGALHLSPVDHKGIPWGGGRLLPGEQMTTGEHSLTPHLVPDPPAPDHHKTIGDAIDAAAGIATVKELREALTKAGVTDKKEQSRLINAHRGLGLSHGMRTPEGNLYGLYKPATAEEMAKWEPPIDVDDKSKVIHLMAGAERNYGGKHRIPFDVTMDLHTVGVLESAIANNLRLQWDALST